LHFAAARGFTDQVEKLIEKGIDINALDINKRTALDYALLWGHDATVEYLKDKGAISNEKKVQPFKGIYLGQTPPGKKPQAFAENLLLTPFSPHGKIAFSPDGREVIWCHHAMPIQAVWHMKESNGVWSKPQIAPFTDPATNYWDGSPCFSADGNRIYYHSHRPTGVGQDRREDSDIWYVQKEGGAWGEPVNAGAPVNSERNEYAPFIDKDGNIYFIGEGYEDSYGTGDIYVCEFIDGKYIAPRNLGEKINSPQHELNPIIAPDGSYLVFASDRPLADPGLNLYICFRTRDDGWTDPAPFGQSVNSGHAWHPHITSEGKYIIYLNGDNYYWFSTQVVEDLKSVVLSPDSIAKVPLNLVQSGQDFGLSNSRKVNLEDLDADGDLDAVFSKGQVWLNDGRGNFSLKQDNMVFRGHGLDVGDIDGDGDADIILAGRSNIIYLNDGKAGFTPYGTVGDSTNGAFHVFLCNFNSDSYPDVAAFYGNDSNVTYINDGAGHFTVSDIILPSSSLCDMDNDGDVDFFVRERGAAYRVMLNEGNNSFTEHWRLADSSIDYGFVYFHDLDKDGDKDAVVTNGGNDNLYPTLLLFNDGTGKFMVIRDDLPRTKWGNVAFGDLNNDGYTDALVTNFRLPNYIFLNDGKGLLYDSGLRLGGNAGNMVSAVGDLDGDGDRDLFISNFEGGSCEVWFNEL
ncbi:MAG: VCBS repeat-containing protein, partial [candidate division Zixibacteria bacterium]|nr:VCBS repeat-containing protein [candidate division Zixibacteria bacterium]